MRGKRDGIINLRVTAQDKSAILAEAKKQGLSASDLLRANFNASTKCKLKKTENLHFRVNKALRGNIDNICSQYSLSISEAIEMLVTSFMSTSEEYQRKIAEYQSRLDDSVGEFYILKQIIDDIDERIESVRDFYGESIPTKS